MAKNDIEAILPLSPLQQGLLFHALADRSHDPYFIQAGFALAGALDADALLRAWQWVAQRHGILRTAFVWEKVENPLQVVRTQATIALCQHDLRGHANVEREVERIVGDDRAVGFDLLKAPLMRLTLIRVDEQRHYFFNSHHHLLLDGWSFALLLREATLAYDALRRGRQPSLPRAESFRSYLAWVGKRERAGAERFFRDTLAGIDTPTPVPCAERLPQQALPFAEQERSFTQAETASLSALARQQRITLNTLVQGAFALMLARHAGQREVVFGSTVSGRPPELLGSETIAGVLINTLPVRVAVDAGTRLDQWLGALQQQNGALREYEWMPLSDVQRCAQIASGTPLFESILVFDSYPEQEVEREPGALEVQPLPRSQQREGDALLTAGRNNYPLSIMVEPNAQLKLIAAYARDRLSHASAASLLRQLHTLLMAMVDCPTARLGGLSLASAAEQALQLDHTGVGAAELRDVVGTAHARIEAHADRTPDASAVVCDGEQISYRELDRRANAVARQLLQRGVGTDARVGLCTERSIAMIVGLLGALKAGAAYVPVDPKWPRARIDEILRDSDAHVVLTTRGLAEFSTETIFLDDVEEADRLPARGHEVSLAYLIYTSGSTGRPKGVAIEHRQLCSYLDGIEARLPLSDVRSFALVSTVAADLGHTGLFGALCAGRTLHVIPSERTFDPDAFAERMHGQQIDALKIVPSHLSALLEAAQPERVLPRRLLILGGEVASPDLLARVRALAPACILINHYGPTETTVGALTHRASEEARLPLGRPLPHVRAYVLDTSLSLLPPGTPGELFLAGTAVARGYHARADLTAERFVPDPFSRVPGARMYRSGDRARLGNDTTLEFLGRMDHQLKVRGNRVELGEIEARIRAQAGVRDAVVVARTDGSQTRLVGYVVGELVGVLEALAASLPDYMVPSQLVGLAALPLTANGKIDRGALPEHDQPSAPREVVAPTGPIETALVEIWRGVLGVEELSVHDNFFARGGDSIRSLQVIARANQRGIRLNPKHLFEHPTIAQVAKVATLGAAKSAAKNAAFALTGLCASEQTRALGDLTLLEDAYPLSPMQEGMLFHTRLNPGSGMYLMQQHYQWSGALDVARVTESWRRVATRHPILRTSFVWDELERPLQRVHKTIQLGDVVHHIDLRGLDQRTQEARVKATLEAELAAGLDMTRAPLMRIRLFQLDEQAYRIVRSFHHILTDDWCFSILMMECLQFYAALGEGRTLSLPEPRPYRDYIAWLASNDLAAAERFYREELRGFGAATPLGIEHPVADPDAHGVGDAFFELTPAQSVRLTALASEHTLTSNTFVQGAWAVLLSRYAQTNDVLFGVTVAGRPTDLPGVESIVGLFINSLPLRVNAAPAQPLLTFLKDLLAHNYRLREHEHPPLVSIQGWSELPPGEALFKSLIVFENAPQDERLGDQVTEVEVAFDGDRVHTNYPITVVAYPGERIGVRLSFDRRWLAQEDVERMLAHLKSLLEDMAACPNKRLGELTMLAEHERDALVTKARELPQSDDYVALFEAQVARTPNAIAVRSTERSLSYDALNRAANRVAHGLRREGVRADSIVAVHEPRDIELLIAALGVLKAGAAYLPLDPAHPEARLAHTLSESGAQLVLTNDPARFLQARRQTREDCAARSSANLGLRAHPRQLAYVIFTSGSTGVPKGALIDHAGMLNNVWGKLPALELTARDVVAQTASQCFDISVWQLLSPLLAGATVEIVDDDTVRDPRALLDRVDRAGISVMELVPSLLRELISESEARTNALASVRWMLPTGEALPPDLARRWFARFPRVPLLNAYGPAECADDVALHRLTQAPDERARYVPIGKAVPNTRLYVTSGDDLAPLGVTGELCVSGIGVGRGYVNDAARTAASFVPDPFARIPGERMYRTGDLARRASDGTLSFVGRRDHQVKVRGYRIELGEIESALRRHPAVRDAVVVARDFASGNTLVAYMVAAHEEECTADVLRTALRPHLPDYMIPALFVRIDQLPRTPNGKLDRRALPEPSECAEHHDGTLEPPRTPTEERIAEVFAHVLQRAHIAREANFFALGGHSLLASQAVSRLRASLGIALPLRALFEQPSVAALGEWVDANGKTADIAGPFAPIEHVARESGARLPLSFAQQRLWLVEQLESGRALHVIPFALRLEGTLDVEALRCSFELVIARHEVLRTAIVVEQGEPWQVVTEVAPFALPVRVLEGKQNEKALAGELVRLVAERLELAAPPLVRAQLLRLAPDVHVLCVALHHIAVDGWSFGILIDELMRAYRGDAARGSERPALQYADYAVWQRRTLTASLERRALDYFRAQLADRGPLALPGRRALPGGAPRAGRLRGALSSSVLAALEARAQAHGATLFIALYAGLDLVLHQQTGRTDLVIGTDVAGRDRRELESMVGFFVNQLVLRSRIAPSQTLDEHLAACRQVALGAYAHQALPFERLVAELETDRVQGRAPLFQVKLVLQNVPAVELSLPGLMVQELALEPADVEVDLLVNVAASEDGLQITYDYRADLYPASYVEQLGALFATTLTRLSEPSSATVADWVAELSRRQHTAREGTAEAERALRNEQRRGLTGARRKRVVIDPT